MKNRLDSSLFNSKKGVITWLNFNNGFGLLNRQDKKGNFFMPVLSSKFNSDSLL
jgi:hypothetical protein